MSDEKLERDLPQPVRGVETPVIRYCLGFLFNVKRNHVLLIEKKRPEWQCGKLNGIGGKLLDSETPFDGMRREYFEATDRICESDWQEICIFGNKEYKCWVFAAFSDEIFSFVYHFMDDKQLFRHDVCGLPVSRLVAGCRWLIPMCLDEGLQSGEYAVRSMTKIFESEY